MFVLVDTTHWCMHNLCENKNKCDLSLPSTHTLSIIPNIWLTEDKIICCFFKFIFNENYVRLCVLLQRLLEEWLEDTYCFSLLMLIMSSSHLKYSEVCDTACMHFGISLCTDKKNKGYGTACVYCVGMCLCLSVLQ